MEYRFALGNTGNAVFSIGENSKLALTVSEKGQKYTLEFLDAVYKEHRFYLREEITCVVDTLDEKTVYTAGEDQLLAVADSGWGIKVYNRFTMDKTAPVITLDTWVDAEETISDCGIATGKTKLDLTGFTQIAGGDIPAKFPVSDKPPRLAFRGYAELTGENQYLKITGGTIWNQSAGVFNAHAQAEHFNDDLSYFDEGNPLRTVYTFGEDVQTERILSSAGREEATGKLLVGSLQIPYLVKQDGVAFIHNGKAYPVAAMRITDLSSKGDFYPDTCSGWKHVTVTENEDYTQFLLMGRDVPQTEELGLCLRADKTREGLSWTVEVINRAADKSVIWCTYPKLYYNPQELCDVFVPAHGGSVEKAFNRAYAFKAGSYPGGLSYAMPYFAIYPVGGGEGVYWGIHDENGAYKDFHTLCDPANSLIRLNCKYPAEHMGEPANGFTLSGKAVWQAFTGDWYDATEVYRHFVQTRCDWVPKANENGREDIPEWMRDVPFWVMDWMPNESDAEEAVPISLRPTKDRAYNPNAWFEVPIKLREELGVPIGYHLYNWHGIPFNNDYPHYLPPKKALKNGLRPLKEAGIRVMPYINVLLWDTKDRKNEDYQFTSVAKPGAVKLSNGDIRTLSYAAHESDGALVKLAPMCPTSNVWREKLKQIVTALFTEYDMDAVYLDQLAAHIPHACMDTSHSHAPGGGDWWQKAYRELMDELNAVKPKDKAYTSEGNAEVYANDLDGFLSWAWVVVENAVPAFMRIYGGRTPALGRNANGYMKENAVYWKYHLAQGLINGEQMGWINSDFVFDEKRLAYARKLIRFRYENRQFFRGARPMRPPVVEADASRKFACGIGMENPGVLYQPYLCVGVLENGKTRKLLAVNICPEEISDTISFIPEELRLSDFRCVGEGKVEKVDDGRLRLTLPADSLLVLEWEV